MKLVMFLDAIEHVSRVARVVRLPLGNALLLGVGGSGRQSLTRLASYLEDFELFQIEVAKGYASMFHDLWFFFYYLFVFFFKRVTEANCRGRCEWCDSKCGHIV